MLSHENALAFVDWAADEFEVTAEDRLSSHAPLHFDLSVFDLFAAARAGAAVVLVPDGLSLFPLEQAKWIRDTGITVWYSVPSILTLLVLRGKLAEVGLLRPPDDPLRRRGLPDQVPARADAAAPARPLREPLRPDRDEREHLVRGPALGGRAARLDPDRQAGAATSRSSRWRRTGRSSSRARSGEMYVRGPTVMQGYWGDAERTEATLFRGWGPGSSPYPTYKTGDLAYVDENGDWVFLGRRDSQIKSRGYRIELGDIEAALDQHPSVVECAVVPIPDEVVTNRIKAFVVTRRRRRPGGARDVRLRAAPALHGAGALRVPGEPFRARPPARSTGAPSPPTPVEVTRVD